LLTPYDFGLLGIAMLAIYTLETFSQTGLSHALIQRRDKVESFLDTAWTISVLRGLVLFIILFLSAPLIAKFFDSPQSTLVIRVIALSTLLSGFKNIGILFFQRELEFHKQFFYELPVTLVDLGVAVTLAFILRNVWALVWAALAASFTSLFFSYVLQPYRPRFKLQKDKFYKLFGYGKWVLGSSVVIFFAAQGDDAFLAKILGVAALGLYQMAFTIGNYPASEITGVVSKVVFPAYARLQTFPQKLKEAYLRTITLVTLMSIPLSGGIITLGPKFTRLFLGEKWLQIITPLQILALSGMFRSIAGTGGAIFNAIGKPKLDFRMNIVRLIVIILSIYPLTMTYGISGTCLSVLLGIISACFVWLYASIRETNTTYKDYLAIIFPPVMGTIFMCGIVVTVLRVDNYIEKDLLTFLIAIIIGAISYFGMMILIEKNLNYHGLQVLKDVYNTLLKDEVKYH
jgi:O-antigen/teichoic acid export membrane protein